MFNLFSESCHTEQIAQIAYEVSLCRDIQKSSEHNPAWARYLDKMTSRCHFQPQTFCEPGSSFSSSVDTNGKSEQRHHKLLQ